MLEGNLYGDVDHPVYQPPVNVFGKSEVLDSEQQFTLSEVFSVNRQYTYELCYRGSTHGFSSSSFHSRCDGKGKTVTIARTTAESPGGPRVFGGFAGSSWHTSSSWISNYDTFLFRFTEEGGFERTDSAKSGAFAQAMHPNYCPAFGDGDLIIHSSCKAGYSNPFSFSLVCFACVLRVKLSVSHLSPPPLSLPPPPSLSLNGLVCGTLNFGLELGTGASKVNTQKPGLLDLETSGHLMRLKCSSVQTPLLTRAPLWYVWGVEC